jgi:GMP synthase-like glutamine amidotransferase
MKTLVFQHTPVEKLGSLRDWLVQSGYPFYVHHLYREEAIPAPEAFDWLVVLGGPMNVDQTGEHPWLRQEKEYIKQWLSLNKPYLGICLGGQLLAQCLGGEVRKNKVREVGFHPVTRTAGEHPSMRRWPLTMTVFQWHEDRFSLPPGCASLLTSEACEHQAFARDHRTLGLQFHPEAVAEWAHKNFDRLEIRPGEPYVQTKHQCLQLLPRLLPAMTAQFYQLLEDFVEGAREPAH